MSSHKAHEATCVRLYPHLVCAVQAFASLRTACASRPSHSSLHMECMKFACTHILALCVQCSRDACAPRAATVVTPCWCKASIYLSCMQQRGTGPRVVGLSLPPRRGAFFLLFINASHISVLKPFTPASTFTLAFDSLPARSNVAPVHVWWASACLPGGALHSFAV